MLGLGIVEATLSDIEGESMRKVDAATEMAKGSPVPTLDQIDKNVWADGSTAWRN